VAVLHASSTRDVGRGGGRADCAQCRFGATAVAACGPRAGVLAAYPAWCAFATLLSTRIWQLNRSR
jgi:hypothetical protein